MKNNQSVNNTDGFLLSSDGSNHTLLQNEARDNYVGFSMSGSGHQLTKNTATDNLSSGFTGDTTCTGVTLTNNEASRNSQYGFDLEGGSGYVLTGNLAGHNFDSGFILAGGNQYILSHNAAVGNYSIGFHLFGGTGHQLLRTAVVGNRDTGILLDTGGTVLISQSNIVRMALLKQCHDSEKSHRNSERNIVRHEQEADYPEIIIHRRHLTVRGGAGSMA